jgi:transposase InsO family protein
MDVLDVNDSITDQAPSPIPVVSNNGPCYRGKTFQARCSVPPTTIRYCDTSAPASSHPNPMASSKRFFGTLKYEHLFRSYIGDGDALDMEVHRFCIIHNTIRTHQALADRTPKQAYLNGQNLPRSSLKTPTSTLRVRTAGLTDGKRWAATQTTAGQRWTVPIGGHSFSSHMLDGSGCPRDAIGRRQPTRGR